MGACEILPFSDFATASAAMSFVSEDSVDDMRVSLDEALATMLDEALATVLEVVVAAVVVVVGGDELLPEKLALSNRNQSNQRLFFSVYG